MNCNCLKNTSEHWHFISLTRCFCLKYLCIISEPEIMVQDFPTKLQFIWPNAKLVGHFVWTKQNNQCFSKNGLTISCIQSSPKEHRIVQFKSILTTVPLYCLVWSIIYWCDLLSKGLGSKCLKWGKCPTKFGNIWCYFIVSIHLSRYVCGRS